MMRPPEGSEKTSMGGCTEGPSSPQRVPNMNKFHILVLIREANAHLEVHLEIIEISLLAKLLFDFQRLKLFDIPLPIQ